MNIEPESVAAATALATREVSIFHFNNTLGYKLNRGVI